MSAGSLVGMIINFILFSVASSVVGWLFDKLVVMMNASGVMGLPMDAFNTIAYLKLIYLAGPFLYALALGYNHVVTSNSESDGVV